MKSWQHLILPCPPDRQDLLIGHLQLLGISGFVQTDSSVEFYILASRTSPASSNTIRAAVRKVLGRNVILEFETVKDQNWNSTWERSMKVVRATDRIIIRPSWKKPRGSLRGKIVITIDPKMSFGTGHHETTRICLKLLEEFMPRKSTVLDFGTGTGVLAIAAAKLGARRVDAVDNDQWSVLNAAENIKANNVERTVRVKRGSFRSIPGKRYGCVIANVDFPTISRTLRVILNRTSTGGVIILSGLLIADLCSILELILDEPVEPILLDHEGEWVGLALRKSARDR